MTDAPEVKASPALAPAMTLLLVVAMVGFVVWTQIQMNRRLISVESKVLAAEREAQAKRNHHEPTEVTRPSRTSKPKATETE